MPRLLVVDDYEDGRELLAELLRVRGFSVHCAASGCDALSEARRGLPDLVLLDLTLPDLDGFEVARRLKADPRTAGIAIVILTAHVSPELQLRAERAGCAGFVTKPCVPTDLVRRIDAALAAERQPQPSL